MTAGVTWVSAMAWVSNPQMPIVQGLVARVLLLGDDGTLGRTLRSLKRKCSHCLFPLFLENKVNDFSIIAQSVEPFDCGLDPPTLEGKTNLFFSFLS